MSVVDESEGILVDSNVANAFGQHQQGVIDRGNVVGADGLSTKRFGDDANVGKPHESVG